MPQRFLPTIIENTCKPIVLRTSIYRNFAGPDRDEPYLDKAPNYERDYKTGSILSQIISRTLFKIVMMLKKPFCRECGDHIENYMNFTNALLSD
jgi:hypothetical protein